MYLYDKLGMITCTSATIRSIGGYLNGAFREVGPLCRDEDTGAPQFFSLFRLSLMYYSVVTPRSSRSITAHRAAKDFEFSPVFDSEQISESLGV